ncbi:MAG: hypothetical protein ACNS62_01705 [Candidatus Cyclobacteriaceae bacterium M3_2C_046]
MKNKIFYQLTYVLAENRLFGLLIFTFIFCFLTLNPVLANPQPGDVFREYHLTGGGSNGNEDEAWADEFVFISHHTGERSTVGARTIKGIDLKNAIKAEFIASHWGGHIGSENKRVVFNDNPGVNLPLIKNTPNQPECYFSQQCQAACEIPLDYLKQGDNNFRLEVDNQICYSFDWGWFWTNQVVLRVYYDPEKVEHPYGKIVSPRSNAILVPFSKVECEIEKGNIAKVEFIGHYNDFSWEGSGEFKTWHGIFWMKDTNLQKHIGTANGLYPYVNWDFRWIPDQENVKIAARLVDKSGLIYMTDPVENLKLSHGDRVVKMYPASNVPEAFATQTDSAICTINIPDDLKDAFLAQIVLSTFSGGTPDREVYLNDVPITRGGWGRWHRLAFCQEYVPLKVLKQGDNEFKIKANMPGEHAFEVNWPGPVLLIEYDK